MRTGKHIKEGCTRAGTQKLPAGCELAPGNPLPDQARKPKQQRCVQPPGNSVAHSPVFEFPDASPSPENLYSAACAD